MKTATVVVVVVLVVLVFIVYKQFQAEQIADTVIKPKRGRPKGSKNKTVNVIVSKPKRGPGRPKGSKNKSKLKTNV